MKSFTNLNNELLYGDRVEKVVELWAKLETPEGVECRFTNLFRGLQMVG